MKTLELTDDEYGVLYCALGYVLDDPNSKVGQDFIIKLALKFDEEFISAWLENPETRKKMLP